MKNKSSKEAHASVVVHWPVKLNILRNNIL